MANYPQLSLLYDIFTDALAGEITPEKIQITLEPHSRTMTVIIEDLDDEDFKEMQEVSA